MIQRFIPSSRKSNAKRTAAAPGDSGDLQQAIRRKPEARAGKRETATAGEPAAPDAALS
jgi:hypothetical protein